jgi:hypothetical protein
MEATMAGVAEPQWARWLSRTVPVTVVFAQEAWSARKSSITQRKAEPRLAVCAVDYYKML